MITRLSDKPLSTKAMVESNFCSADTQRLKTDYLAAQKVLNIPYIIFAVCDHVIFTECPGTLYS